jgi:ubiquinone/menaquinone biosynthesis C-methylase UbiE
MSAKYDSIGTTYNATRRADPRIVDRIVALLDLPQGSRILDVGAGTGSYTRELAGRGFMMTALEPSSVMRAQVSPDFPCEWLEGVAESLPFNDGTFDGMILILCIHHFTDMAAAFSEIRRVVSSGPIVIFSYDPDAVETPWLFEYFSTFREQIRQSFPSVKAISECLKSSDSINASPFPLPHDLADGFAGAAWRYPEKYLDKGFRDGTSAFRQLDDVVCRQGLAALQNDLESGVWDTRFGAIRSLQEYDHGYTFITIQNNDMIIHEMQKYYSLRAGEYDASMGYDDPEVIERHQPVIAELRNIAADREVLELACGPCFWTQQIADIARKITATDFNESTLAEARKKDLPWDRVSLQQADAYDLDPITGDFNMVLAVDWFAHVPKSRIADFLSGVIRRLPDASPLVLIDQTPGSGSWTGETDHKGNHIQERVLASGERFRVIKHFFSNEEIHEHLEPHTRDLTIKRFPDCRRVLVHGFTKNK